MPMVSVIQTFRSSS